MWDNAPRDGRHASSVQRRKVWLTLTTRVPCSKGCSIVQKIVIEILIEIVIEIDRRGSTMQKIVIEN